MKLSSEYQMTGDSFMDRLWETAEPSPVSTSPKLALGVVVILIIGTSYLLVNHLLC